jgi:hypothetical protein
MLDTDAPPTTSWWRPKAPTRRRVSGQPGQGTQAADLIAAGPPPGRRRRGSGDDAGTFDLRNSWQVIVGSLLIPLGVVFILLAWYGAAHAKVIQQQIPYMVSGSFAGLGCLFVGGMLFWGHWLYRVYDQADLHHREQTELLETLISAIAAGQITGSGVTVLPGSTGTATGSATYYATASGSVYHRAGCAVIAHHPTDLRVLGPDDVSGLRPCQICDPG